MHFPLDSNIGTDISDIPIIVICNGFNHYCPTKCLRPTFKDGVKELVAFLSGARALCDQLGMDAEDPLVKQVFSKASENSQNAMYSVDKLMQTAHESTEEEAAAPSGKRRRDSGDKKVERKARDGKTQWTPTICKCGVEKHTIEELKSHIERRYVMLIVSTTVLFLTAICQLNLLQVSRNMSRTSTWMNIITGVSIVLITKQIRNTSSPTTSPNMVVA